MFSNFLRKGDVLAMICDNTRIIAQRNHLAWLNFLNCTILNYFGRGSRVICFSIIFEIVSLQRLLAWPWLSFNFIFGKMLAIIIIMFLRQFNFLEFLTTNYSVLNVCLNTLFFIFQPKFILFYTVLNAISFLRARNLLQYLRLWLRLWYTFFFIFLKSCSWNSFLIDSRENIFSSLIKILRLGMHFERYVRIFAMSSWVNFWYFFFCDLLSTLHLTYLL